VSEIETQAEDEAYVVNDPNPEVAPALDLTPAERGAVVTASVPIGGKAICSRCKRAWKTFAEDHLHDTPPILRWDGDVCEECLLDLLDISLGQPPRSGRDLPATNEEATSE
jgi:hypothetical protein